MNCRRVQRVRGATLAVVLVACALVACTSDDEAATPGVTAPRPTLASDDVCGEIYDADSFTEPWADLVPPRHRSAMMAAVTVHDAFQFERIRPDDLEFDVDEAVATALAPTGVDGDLADLASWLENECGPSEVSSVVRGDGYLALAIAAPLVDDYCALLGNEPEDPVPHAITASAPDSHRWMWDLLAATSLDTTPDVGLSLAAAEAIDIYARRTCRMEGSPYEKAFGALLMWAATAPDALDGPPTTIAPAGIAPADPSAAKAAVPVDSDLTFSAQVVDVDTDEERLAAVVLPDGWAYDPDLGSAYDPDGYWATAPMISFMTFCEGPCEATDWEARLRASNGLVADLLDHPGASQRPAAGAPGIVVTTVDPDDGGIEVDVVRWNDRSDTLFRCTITIDEYEDRDLVDALTAACEAARPAWFPA